MLAAGGGEGVFDCEEDGATHEERRLAHRLRGGGRSRQIKEMAGEGSGEIAPWMSGLPGEIGRDQAEQRGDSTLDEWTANRLSAPGIRRMCMWWGASLKEGILYAPGP